MILLLLALESNLDVHVHHVWCIVPEGLSLYFPSICRRKVSRSVIRAYKDKLTAAEVALSWLDLPVTLKATPLGAVSLNSKVVAERW